MRDLCWVIALHRQAELRIGELAVGLALYTEVDGSPGLAAHGVAFCALEANNIFILTSAHNRVVVEHWLRKCRIGDFRSFLVRDELGCHKKR